jgi:hypothetical protein
VEAGSGDHRDGYSGEPAVEPRQQASVEAPTGPRADSSSFGWQRRGPEGDARRGRTGGWWWTETATGSVHAQGGNSGFL